MGKQKLDILGMSDEDFEKMGTPPVVESSDATDPETDPADETDTDTETDPAEDPSSTTETQDNTQGAAAATDSTADESQEEEEEAPPPVAQAASQQKEEPAKTPPEGTKTEETPAGETPDYAAFYRQVMTPFKANGKLIQLHSPEEVIQLMQMGANYTRKMQEIGKYRKFVMMLENNQLLDEGKLSFLIDLHQKNPEAIKQLVKDAGIDPIDIDISAQSNYKSGLHAVSDQEVTIATAIDSIKELPGGNETLQSINGWDQASKKVLWENPGIMSLIHSQRASGIYDQIVGEMDRRQALGLLGPSVPFLQAYKAIGDELNARGAFRPVAQPATPAPPPVLGRTPVARTVSPQTKATDNQKVRAAASPRTAPRAASATVNPLAMSDDEFLKNEELLRKMGTRI